MSDNFNDRRKHQGRERQAATLAGANRNREPWTPEEDAIVSTPLSETVTISQLAARIGRTYWSVHVRRQQLGVSSTHKPDDEGPVLCPCGAGYTHQTVDHEDWCPDNS